MKIDLDFSSNVPKEIKSLVNNFVGFIIGDKVKSWRTQNCIDICKKLSKKNKDIEINNLEKKFGVKFFEKASLESDEYLQEVWANLLLNKLKKNINVFYIDILSQLTNRDVKILNSSYEYFLKEKTARKDEITKTEKDINEISNYLKERSKDEEIILYLNLKNTNESNKIDRENEKIKNYIQKELDHEKMTMALKGLNYISISINDKNLGLELDNLLRLNLIDKAESSMMILAGERVQTSNKYRFSLTDLGKDFILSCRG